MILTQCAVCATPLPHPRLQCGICKTPYCGRDCQKLHWKGGHQALCPQIKRGGGAEQYHATQKYAEAVAVAVMKCSEDTRGQTCYICTEALHWKTKEGLVRGCACRGTAGVAHVSCLVEEAKILVAEGLENNLGNEAKEMRWARWHTCSLCEQGYHGVVIGALGWACWKTYVGRQVDGPKMNAMAQLANGLSETQQHEVALSVREAELSTLRRLGQTEEQINNSKANLAFSYECLGRHEEALVLRRELYAWGVTFKLPTDEIIIYASNLAVSLKDNKCFEEARCFLRERIAEGFHRTLGVDHLQVMKMRAYYAQALSDDDRPSRDDLVEAIGIYEDLSSQTRRVLGGSHPFTGATQQNLLHVRWKLARLDAHS